MTTPATDEALMQRAVTLARMAWGQTHPNPLVGAVIVEEGVVVAEGFHARDGTAHAERVALANLGRPPKKGATLYVTLEPCSTHGRTGACCEAILAAGISRVVVGATDPNPAHAGGGFAALRAAGVEVVTGVLEDECRDLNLIFNHWITRGSPLLAAKAAISLDGRMATRLGDSQWITNEASRANVHHWRRLFPAIAVGARTISKDNPRLTARIGDGEWCPWRMVFDGLLRTAAERTLPKVYTDEYRDRTIVVTTEHGGLGYVRKLRDQGVKVWVLPSATQRVNVADFRAQCAAEKITGVYFEGGPLLLSELIASRAIDYLFAYRAPLLLADDKARSIFGGLRTEKVSGALRLTDIRREQFGDDDLIRGQMVYPEKLHPDENALGHS